ncbi:MAG: hypothetical protein Q8K86_09040 [Candidatus Nanopelagicaceae bacterium]|nr:hypothetical protein [Candidatus Nanopelagicaceae bacterium]
MKLSLLEQASPSDDFIQAAAGSIGSKLGPMTQNLFKKQSDPNYPELNDDGTKGPLPYRSGNQDTPMKPRHRKYFNAPLGATQGKIGWGEPLGAWPPSAPPRAGTYRKSIKT